MKNLWKAVSVVCVMNAVAILVVAAWLCLTDRLTVERVRSIRTMLSMTEGEASAEAAEMAAAEEAAESESEARERASNPPPPSAIQVANRASERQVEQDRLQRLESDLAALRRQLDDGRQALIADRSAHEAEVAAWEEQRAALLESGGDDQFMRVVKLLEGVPAAQAKETLVGLMGSGNVQDAVAYLNAMKPFAAAKVLKAFKGDDQPLATELLQRMKALGHEAESAGNALDADDVASAG